MRIVLSSIHPYRSPQAVPLAAALLKGYVRRLDVEVVLHEALVSDAVETTAAQLAALRPAAIGFSLYLWNREFAVAVARRLRRDSPGVVLFCGGPEATADPHGLLGDLPFDAVVIGEGEIPFATLCSRLAAGVGLTDIPGLQTRNAVPAPPPQTAIDLDAIPSPWLNGILDAKQYRGILWQIARGCSFGCEFCYDARDRFGVRRASLQRIEAELRHFAACGVDQVFVLDSTFNQDRTRAKAILRSIKELAPEIHFHFEVRSEFLDRESAQLFASLRASLQIGLQSADPHVLTTVGRNFSRDDFVAKVNLLNRSGATFGFDLMIGLPGDTLDGFRASLDFALGLYPNQLDIFPHAILPGTRLAQRADALGLRHHPAPPYTITATSTLPEVDLASALDLAAACDIFYSRGKAVAWFNSVLKALGTTPSRFLASFADWLIARHGGVRPDPSRCNDEQIRQWQREFLAGRFDGKLRRARELALDLVDYHYHYAQAIKRTPLSPQTTTPQRGSDPLSQVWRLAPSVRIVDFHYDILALLAAGEPNIRRLSEQLPKEQGAALIFPSRNGVQTEPLDSGYIKLLRQLDGKTPADKIVGRLKLHHNDVRGFLRIAISNGIVLPN